MASLWCKEYDKPYDSLPTLGKAALTAVQLPKVNTEYHATPFWNLATARKTDRSCYLPGYHTFRLYTIWQEKATDWKRIRVCADLIDDRDPDPHQIVLNCCKDKYSKRMCADQSIGTVEVGWYQERALACTAMDQKGHRDAFWSEYQPNRKTPSKGDVNQQ